MTKTDESILSEHACKLGEGPVCEPARETLFWFDILGCKRHALHMPSRRASVLDLSGMASAMAVTDAGRAADPHAGKAFLLEAAVKPKYNPPVAFAEG